MYYRIMIYDLHIMLIGIIYQELHFYDRNDQFEVIIQNTALLE
jgi:hypothetical protein